MPEHRAEKIMMLLPIAGRITRGIPRQVMLRVYDYPSVAHFLRSIANRFVPDGLTEVQVAGGALAGARLLLDLRLEKYLWLGTYEPWVQEAITANLRPGEGAWDVGAFIGYHTLLMRRVAGPNCVVAFEPDSVNRGRLERNLAVNRATDVRVVSMAAGKSREQSRLQRVSGQGPQSHLAPGGEVECETIPLDALLPELPVPRLIKIDVEGAETDVLAGAYRLVHEVRPVWIVEVHGSDGWIAIDGLRSAGYRVRRFGKGMDVKTNLPVGGPAHVIASP